MMLALALLIATPPEGEPLRLVHRDGRVEITRDEWGVAHIHAPTWRAALWGSGYAQAEDRLWQMEELRRSARSRSAELFGRVGLASDMRRLETGYTEEEMGRILEGCSERYRTALHEFADGVNTFLREERWPADYRRVRSEPVPWDELDSLAIGVAMARRLGESGNDEFDLTRLHGYLTATMGEDDAADIFADLFHGDDPAAPTTVGDEIRDAPPEGTRPPATRISDEAWARWTERRAAVAADDAQAGLPTYSGSVAWAVAPSRTAGGRAILYGAPMMGFGAPSIAWEVHLVCPEFDAYGMAFPGVPGVIVGFTRRHAWTFTSGQADLVDVYELELNPENPDQYRFDGAWRDIAVIETGVRVRRQQDEPVRIIRSVHGPVTVLDPARLRAYATRSSFWMEEIRTMEAFLDFSFATTPAEFSTAVSRITTSHNIVYADAGGHIAFWFAGRHPRRREGHDPRFIQPGDGSMEWDGFLDFAEVPQAVDPARGYLVNWNNRPSRSWAPWWGGRVFWGQGAIEHVERFPLMTIDDAWACARECAEFSWTAHFYRDALLRGLEEGDDDLAQAAELLRSWDGRDTADSAGAFLMAEWSGSMLAHAFRPVMGPLAFGLPAQRYLASPMLDLLEGREMRYDYLGDRLVDDLSRAAMERVIEMSRESLGEDMTQWRRVSVIPFGDAGETPSPSSRGTYTLVVELGDPPRAMSILPPGQSADPESPHYRDQLPLFEAWAGRSARLDE